MTAAALAVVVLLFAALPCEAAPTRHVTLRGVPKSGTTWLEMAMVALLSCHDERSSGLSIRAVLDGYSRTSSSYRIRDELGLADSYALHVDGKHLFDTWRMWSERGRARQPDPNHLTVVIFRDPKDTALSHKNWSGEDPVARHADADATLAKLLRVTDFHVEPLLAGRHVSAAGPDNFLASYELMRACEHKTLWALADFLLLPLANRSRCVAFAQQAASLSAMEALERDGLLPARSDSRVKVQDGRICHAVDDGQLLDRPSKLPPEWRRFFGDHGQCTMWQSVDTYSHSSLPGICKKITH